MAYNAETAARNRAAREAKEQEMTQDQTSVSLQDMVQAMTEAFRQAVSPSPPPPPDLVTIKETSDGRRASDDPELDRLLFCPDCLGRDGPAWGSHMVYWVAADPTRPGQVRRMEELHAHPQARKTITYDRRAAKDGLEKGTHGKQCLQCGAKLHPVAA